VNDAISMKQMIATGSVSGGIQIGNGGRANTRNPVSQVRDRINRQFPQSLAFGLRKGLRHLLQGGPYREIL
jgi:hypothetical protein